MYRTYEDLAKNNVEYLGEQHKTHGTYKGVALGNKMYWWKNADFYGYTDMVGNVLRIYDGREYNILSYGKVFLYAGNYSFNSWSGTPEVYKRHGFPTDQVYGRKFQPENVKFYYSMSANDPLIELKKWNKITREEWANLFFSSDETIKKEFLNDKKTDYYLDEQDDLNNIERIVFYLNKLNGLTK